MAGRRMWARPAGLRRDQVARCICVSAVWALGLQVGCGGPAPLPPRAQQLLDQAREAYARGDDVTAIGQADILLREYRPGGRAELEALYYRGRARFRAGSDQLAARDLQQVAESQGEPALAASAKIVLGDLAAENDQLAQARRWYQAALERTEARSHPTDYAMFRLGCLLQRMGQWDQADLYLARLVHVFGDTELARQAGDRLNATAWTLRAGAYEQPAEAEQAAARWQGRSLPASVRAVWRQGRPQLWVCLGRFDTDEQARQARQHSQAPTDLTITVVD